ncbi:hypothetical protein [Candidatus Uabimicrobium sp. HlEnr_7]|uniref:hypothetical protein n=1 Tax=Candidatus Uabimicrobium helgolandensis TaxID=3095367 RepID=UPI003556AF4A
MSIVATTQETPTFQRGQISSVDFDRVVKRIAKEHNFSLDESRRILNSTIDFLSLCAHVNSFGRRNKKGLSPSRKVDIGWHEFLMYTKAYTKFSKSLGVPFIHHEPNDNPNTDKKHFGGKQATVNYMLANNIVFDAEIWEVKSNCDNDCHVSCQEGYPCMSSIDATKNQNKKDDCIPDPCTCSDD